MRFNTFLREFYHFFLFKVSVGGILIGGSAQLSGVMRTGDKLISIDGKRVIGATHAEVLKLLDRAAHTVGQVTLGLQRSNTIKVSKFIFIDFVLFGLKIFS